MLIQLSGRIWYYEGEEETDRPYLYYIRGDEKSAVIDAGNSERHVKSFYQALAVGDAFCGDYYDGGGACDPEKVRAMLTLWGELPFDTALPGHSPPCPREELVQWLTEETDT